MAHMRHNRFETGKASFRFKTGKSNRINPLGRPAWTDRPCVRIAPRTPDHQFTGGIIGVEGERGEMICYGDKPMIRGEGRNHKSFN